MRILIRGTTDFISSAKRRLDAIDADHTVAVLGCIAALFSLAGATAALITIVATTGIDLNRGLAEMSGPDALIGVAVFAGGLALVLVALSLVVLGRAANHIGAIIGDAEAMVYLAADEHIVIERPRGEPR